MKKGSLLATIVMLKLMMSDFLYISFMIRTILLSAKL